MKSLGETHSILVPSARMLPALHGLRGVAACTVLLFHLIHLTHLPVPPILGPIATHGGLGVHLFFVLSAFSLAHSHFRDPVDTRSYLIKRFFRIAPLFYAVLIYAAGRTLYYGRDLPVSTVLANLTFTFNLIPDTAYGPVQGGWSVGVEMIFYLLLPVALLCIRTVPMAVLFAVIVNAASWSVAKSISGMPEGLQSSGYFGVAANMGIFASGLAGYFVYRALPASISRASALMFAAAIAAVALVLVFPLLWASPAPARPAVRLLWGVLFAAIVLWQARAPLRLLSSALMQYLGERSYSIYLLHPVAIGLCLPIYEEMASQFAGLGNWLYLLGLAITLLVLLPAVELTYRFIEVPGIGLGRRLLAKRRAHRGDAPALMAK